MNEKPIASSVDLVEEALELLGRSGRHGFLPVRGASMSPTLGEGVLLAVELEPDRLRTGDLLLFRQDRDVVIHRLLGRCRLPSGGRGWRTRGDGVPYLDPAVRQGSVLGRGVAFRDADGWWDLRTPGAMLYARFAAAHDLFWAAAGTVAGGVDRAAARLRWTIRLRGAVGRLDRLLLTLARGVAFRPFHRRVSEAVASEWPTEPVS